MHPEYLFGPKSQSLATNLFNYEHPMAEANIDGVNYRIGNGLTDLVLKKKTYILYADGKEIGTYYSLKEAKEAVKQ